MHLGLLQSAGWVEGRVAKPGYVVFGLVPQPALSGRSRRGTSVHQVESREPSRRPKDCGTALYGVPGIEVFRLEEPDALRTGQLPHQA